MIWLKPKLAVKMSIFDPSIFALSLAYHEFDFAYHEFLCCFRVAVFALIRCLSSSAAVFYPFLLTRYR